MKLSELAFNTIQKTILYENNNSFNMTSFRKYCYSLTTNSGNDTDGFSISPDYKRNCDNIFIALNSAFQRLATLDKLIPHKKIVVLKDNEVDLDSLIPEVDKVLNVYDMSGKNLEFRNSFLNKIHVYKKLNKNTVMIEYYPELPIFNYFDIAFHKGDEYEEVVDNDIDLRKEYGISNKTCEYLSLYAKGILLRDIDPSESASFINQAESYFLDLEDYGGSILHSQRNYVDFIGDL